ncbi:hypothetical protein BH23GEM11_BH23GEM11_06640 [soil metagenome]
MARKLQSPVPTETAEAALEEFSRLAVVLVDTTMIGSAARTSRLHTVSFWDALTIEAAQASGASELLSEDLQEGRRFGSLVIGLGQATRRGAPGAGPRWIGPRRIRGTRVGAVGDIARAAGGEPPREGGGLRIPENRSGAERA